MTNDKPINVKSEGDHGYVCFFKGKRCEVYGKTLLAARTLAAKHFKARKEYEVTIMVAERPDGSTVVHTAVD